MDIKQFVKESVSQIVEAINESNPKLQSIGSFIPTGGMIGEGVLFSANSEPSKDANKGKHPSLPTITAQVLCDCWILLDFTGFC